MSKTAVSPPPPAVGSLQGCCCKCACSDCTRQRPRPFWRKTGQQHICPDRHKSKINKKGKFKLLTHLNLKTTYIGCFVTSSQFPTFLGGGGGFWANASFTASAADSGSLFSPFLESVSDRTTKKWWHFSHLTNRVDAIKGTQEKPN